MNKINELINAVAQLDWKLGLFFALTALLLAVIQHNFFSRRVSAIKLWAGWLLASPLLTVFIFGVWEVLL